MVWWRWIEFSSKCPTFAISHFLWRILRSVCHWMPSPFPCTSYRPTNRITECPHFHAQCAVIIIYEYRVFVKCNTQIVHTCLNGVHCRGVCVDFNYSSKLLMCRFHVDRAKMDKKPYFPFDLWYKPSLKCTKHMLIWKVCFQHRRTVCI